MNKIKVSCFSLSSNTHQFDHIYLYSHNTQKKYSLNNALHLIDYAISSDNIFNITYNSFIDFLNYQYVYFRLGDMLYSINLIDSASLTPNSTLTLNIKTSLVQIDKIDSSEFVSKSIICQKDTALNFQPKISLNIGGNDIVFSVWTGDRLIRTSIDPNGAIACVTFNSHSAILCINIPGSNVCTKKNIIITSEYVYDNYHNEIFQYNCSNIRPVFISGKILTKHLLLSKDCNISSIDHGIIPITTSY